MRDYGQRLLALGTFLFLLGLLTGLVIGQMPNPRMGLAAHLEGVMNGMFLMIVGLAWQKLSLAGVRESVTYWLLLYGSFLNWLLITAASILGTSDLTPIAGAGFKGSPFAESLISAGLITVAISMIAGSAMLVLGFVQRR